MASRPPAGAEGVANDADGYLGIAAEPGIRPATRVNPLGEINDPGFAVFSAEGEQGAVRAPRQRCDRRIAWLFRQNLGAVFDADQQHHAVAVTGGDDVLFWMTGDRFDLVVRRCLRGKPKTTT